MSFSRLLAAGLCIAIAGAAPPAMAVRFETRIIELDHPANGDVVPLRGTHWLAASGHSSAQRWLSLVDRETGTARRLTPPPSVQFFAAAKLAGHEGEQLVLLGAEGIYRWSAVSGVFERMLDTASIYRGVDGKRLRSAGFAKDVSGNGLSDFVVPDFDVCHLFVQRDDGSFAHHVLPIAVQMRTLERLPSYVPRVPFVVDFTLDGRPDLVFVVDGRFHVFRQQASGEFAVQPQIEAPGVLLTPELEAELRPGDGRDFAGLQFYRVQQLEDLNGNGIADLVVLHEFYQDGIEQRDTYRIHYGRRGPRGVEFRVEPDTAIDTAGMQLEPMFVDVDGNGRTDVGTTTATLGLGTIIRALLTGASNMDLLFYRMAEDGTFQGEPDYRQTARVEISLRTRQVDMPLLRLADLTGNGRKSLLVSEGTETLWVYPPDGRALFSRRGDRLRVTLPRENANVVVTDLNGNGKDDLVLPFGPRDGELRQHQLVLMFTP